MIMNLTAFVDSGQSKGDSPSHSLFGVNPWKFGHLSTKTATKGFTQRRNGATAQRRAILRCAVASLREVFF